MTTKPFYRCTFEWDEPDKEDSRGDMRHIRHICILPMHHDGIHRSETPVVVKKSKRKKNR